MTETRDPGEIFLTAEWRDLLFLNYAVEPRLLMEHVPAGTMLDSFDGKTFVSLVGFRFYRTKLFGAVAVPFHEDFEEINLRFYVRPQNGYTERRGVVFISEIVPRWAIAATARLIYGEKYHAFAMQHSIVTQDLQQRLEYRWKMKNQWCSVKATADGQAAIPKKASLEEFITEHYWGYSSTRGGGCVEYHVAHPQWSVRQCIFGKFEGDARPLYGELAQILNRTPDSAFLASGSPVTVYRGRKII